MAKKNNVRKVINIQSGDDYEHKPGVKNRLLKTIRKYEFLYGQYRDRYDHGDVTVADKKVLQIKMQENEAKYGYHNKIYDDKR